MEKDAEHTRFMSGIALGPSRGPGVWIEIGQWRETGWLMVRRV